MEEYILSARGPRGDTKSITAHWRWKKPSAARIFDNNGMKNRDFVRLTNEIIVNQIYGPFYPFHSLP
jgi:hypothetical protein